MNADSDPLEEELTALSPAAISPGLRRRIAEGLAEPGIPRRSRRRLLALTGAIAAAGLVAIACWWSGGSDDARRVIVGPRNVPQINPPPIVRPAARVGTAGWEPRLLTYRLALGRSPEELDVLLNRESTAATESHSQIVQFRAFTPSNASLNALLGDD